jgi:hypothetical protein
VLFHALFFFLFAEKIGWEPHEFRRLSIEIFLADIFFFFQKERDSRRIIINVHLKERKNEMDGRILFLTRARSLHPDGDIDPFISDIYVTSSIFLFFLRDTLDSCSLGLSSE